MVSPEKSHAWKPRERCGSWVFRIFTEGYYNTFHVGICGGRFAGRGVVLSKEERQSFD